MRSLTSAIIASLACCLPANAASPEKYAASSVLSDGNWAKIDIKTPGLQTITRQTLRNFGFSDPEKVYVYGYGGRMVPEALRPDLPDDLPPAPVIRNSDGSISFYATGNITPTASSTSSMTFDHNTNPYCESSYYFLSDKAPQSLPEPLDLSDTEGLTPLTSFTFQQVHEQDIIQCANSGRDYLGEDFRSAKSQEFKFDLPDNVDGNARIRVRFAANTSGAQSSFTVTANGETLAATNSDRIAATTSSEQYYKIATSVKNATGVGNSLSVGIQYSQAGVVSIARLDWIEVEYTRALKMRDSQLYFHVNPKRASAYTISGVSENAIVWDVTSPHAVREVKGVYDSAEKTLTIGIRKGGMREFFIFEPGTKGASVPGRIKVPNQDIHAMTTPDMLIITPDEYVSAAERFAKIHRSFDGMTVHILTPEKIYNEFSGGHPDVSAFRKLMKMWHDRSQADSIGPKFKYCLLLGRPTYDQKRKNPETLKHSYPNTLIWQSQGALAETSSYCTDDFIAMLEDESTVRNMKERSIDVGVGRYPVTSLAEANSLADKLESYISSSDYGIWRNNIMVIADDGDGGQHLTQGQESIQHMQNNPAGANYAYERLFLDAYMRKQTGTGLEFPDAKQKMLKKWQKEGVAIINYIGHANPKEWSHEKLLTWLDINNMTNQHLPILYAATCSFGKWDDEAVSGAEIMLSNPAGGAIAIVTPSRTVYIAKNKNITNCVSAQMTRRDADGFGLRIGDVLRLGKNNMDSKVKDDNINRYHLFGDPALRMPIPQYNVTVDSIAGAPTADDAADAPTVMARASVTVSGKITDSEGNPTDFNGPVQYVLFDAEKSVTTHGWGDSGVVTTYTDRSSKLATGSTIAQNGIWSADILMPSEISNNYSPALLTLYAYDPNLKIEANGSTDRLYVFGYDYTSSDDTEGPTIESFGINSPSFVSGDVVNANSTAIASFHDESGINISDAGIGHKMTLTLDGSNVFDDLDNFYVPDYEADGKGSIAYPLTDIQPGEHTLTLTVWDNANNSSSETISFKVGVNMKPALNDLTTVYNRDSDSLNIYATSDRPLSKLTCSFECFSLNGDLLWSSENKIYADKDSAFRLSWDLKDVNGNRLPRGIYILRTSVTSDEGITTTKSRNFAIPAQ